MARYAAEVPAEHGAASLFHAIAGIVDVDSMSPDFRATDHSERICSGAETRSQLAHRGHAVIVSAVRRWAV